MPVATVSRREHFKSMLRKARFRATPARLAVLALMHKSRSPLSAQEIIAQTGADFHQVTVYRIMKDLELRGMIKQIDLRHNHAHYELTDITDHHHLICTQCGRMEDITGCEVEGLYASVLHTAHTFAEVQQHSLEFYGICKKCAAVKKTE